MGGIDATQDFGFVADSPLALQLGPLWTPAPALAAVVVAAVVLRFLDRLIADPAHAEAVRASRLFRPVIWLAASAALAAAVPWLWVTSAVLTPVDGLLLTVAIGLLAGSTPALIAIDVAVHRLPDRIVVPTVLTLVVLGGLGGVLTGASVWSSALVSAIIAFAAFGALHLLGRVVRAKTLGLGDVKLAAMVGFAAGLASPWGLAPVFVVTMLAAAVWALVLLVGQRRSARSELPFGPSMLTGMWLGSVLAPLVL